MLNLNRLQLQKKLKFLQAIIPAKIVMPREGCVEVEINGGIVSFRSSSGTVQCVSTLGGISGPERSPPAKGIVLKEFLAALKGSKASTINLAHDAEGLRVFSDFGETKIPFQAVEYPSARAPLAIGAPDSDNRLLPGFSEIVNWLDLAVSRVISRASICQLFLEAGGACVTTDGARAHKAQCAVQLTRDVFIPANAVKAISRLTGDISIMFEGYRCAVFGDNGSVWFENKAHEAHPDKTSFPPWRQVVPSDNRDDTAVTLTPHNIKSWISILRSFGQVKLSISGGKIIIETTSGTVSRNAELPYRQVSGALKEPVCFEGAYLADALSGFRTDRDAQIRIDGPLDPIAVSAGDRLGIVMPHRL